MITVPQIHMNGTSRDELVRGYKSSIRALEAALVAVAFTAPNGRDYYPLGQEAISSAMTQHQLRLQHLREVLDEINQIAEAIVD